MKQTLSELYRGDINPKGEKTESYEKEKNLSNDLERCYNILWNQLDTDGKRTLGELRECHTALSLLKTEDSFIQGFSLAVKMMTEAISE